jgi:two-component system, cell cycle sensor histidine kinase and response regulator CckA
MRLPSAEAPPCAPPSTERQFQALFQSALDAMIILDDDARLVDVNPATSQVFDVPRGELLGRRLDDFFADPAGFGSRWSTFLRRGTLKAERVLTVGGREFTVELSATAHFTPGRHLVIARDVTERRRAEQAVRESEERYRVLFDSNPQPVFVCDAGSLRILQANRAAQEHYGYTVDEIVALTLKDIRPPEEVPALLRRLAEGVQRSAPQRHRRKDGSIFEVEVIANRFHLEGREYILGVVTDISERRRAEAALEAREQEITDRQAAQSALRLLERAIEGISQGLLVCDARRPDTPLIYVNPGFERLTGYTAAEVVGRNPRILHGPLTDAHARRQMREAIAAGRPVSVEVLNYRKDGTTFWNRTSITPVVDDAGQVTHYVGQQLDVTEARRLQEQLLQSQKMDAMGTLAGGIAHDFNNLLMVIGGYSAQLLRALPADNPLHRKVEAIQHATDRATALTRQLLTFSRREVVAPRVLDLNAVLAGVDKILRRLVGEHIDLVCLPARNEARVRADASQIEQVLMNLVVNARDAMPGGGTLTIEVTNVDLGEETAPLSAGRYVSVRVTDTGTGMDPATLVRVFEPFFTTKAAGKGTGLGLSTVYGIVTQGGGTVTVDSEPGRGTTFTVLLPRTDAAVPALGHATEAVKGGHETILVAEDDPAVRELVCGGLSAEGYSVLEARYPGEAVEIATRYQGPIHLLLTDVVMPQMNGLELARKVTAGRPSTAVLYMSGYVDEFPEESDFLARFITKPISMSALNVRVRQELDRVPAADLSRLPH